jgi:dTDP-4-dehydrorhamnose 3,5-epimerase
MKPYLQSLAIQHEPHAQGKLVRALRGSIFDVAVDLRPDSEFFGRWIGVELSAENGLQLWIPRGFAHGFCTLMANTEVLYKTDAYYAPDADAGLRWDDPDISVAWPIAGREPVLSDKDLELPRLLQMEPGLIEFAV